jgi:hypothetical protein
LKGEKNWKFPLLLDDHERETPAIAGVLCSERQDLTKKIKEAIPDTWNCLFALFNLVTEQSRNWYNRSFQLANYPVPHFRNVW